MVLTQRRKDANAQRRARYSLRLCVFASLREKLVITTSERELHARVVNPATTTNRIRNRRVTNRRFVEIKRLVIPTDHLVFEREEIETEAEITRLSKLSEDLRKARVRLKTFGYDHRRTLYLECVIEQPRRNYSQCLLVHDVGELEIIQPAPEILSFKRKAAILETTIDRRHAISRIGDRDAWPEDIGSENYSSIR